MSGLAARTWRADGAQSAVGAVVVDHHAAMIYAMSILAALFVYRYVPETKGRTLESIQHLWGPRTSVAAQR